MMLRNGVFIFSELYATERVFFRCGQLLVDWFSKITPFVTMTAVFPIWHLPLYYTAGGGGDSYWRGDTTHV